MITKNLSSFWQKTYDDDKKHLLVLNLKTIKGAVAIECCDSPLYLYIPNIYSPVKLINFEFQKNCFFMIFLTDLL